MSVIVKGMKMPEYCYDCPLHDGENGRCNILGITVYDYIPKECPLVGVVRCKDCKYGNEITDVKGLHFIVCANPFGHGLVVENHGFCKWGGRREDEQDKESRCN